MKDSLPTGWAVVSLGETGDYINGFAFKPGHRESEGKPIIRIQNLTDETKPLNRTRLSVPDQYKVSTGDMLVSWSATLDVFWWRREPAVVNQHIFKVVPREDLISKGLLFHWLKRAIDQLQETEHLHGSTMKHINRGPFLAHEVPLPPRDEQERIVAKLDEILSDLDAGVAELKAAQQKLQRYRQSLLKAAVEGALTAEWRQKNPPTETGAELLQRILRKRRAHWEEQQLAKFAAQGKAPPKGWKDKYPEPQPSKTEGLPELPEGWGWASAEQLCTFITKGTTPPKELNSAGTREIPFLRVTNLTDRGVLDMSDEVFVSAVTHQGFLARSRVFPSDVLMNIVGPPLGQVALVPEHHPEWNINQAIAIFRAVDVVHPGFICNYLLSPVAQQWLKERAKTTAGQTNLTLEVCRQLPIPLPPPLEQAEIVSVLFAQTDGLSSRADELNALLHHATAQRQNLLRAAFLGELVPQDPNDEPASVLLARLRAERSGTKPAKTERKTRKAKGAA